MIMKILYDYQAFDIQRSGGVSNVFSLLVQEMRKREEVRVGIASTTNLYMLSQGYPSESQTLERLMSSGKISPETTLQDLLQERHHEGGLRRVPPHPLRPLLP